MERDNVRLLDDFFYERLPYSGWVDEAIECVPVPESEPCHHLAVGRDVLEFVFPSHAMSPDSEVPVQSKEE